MVTQDDLNQLKAIQALWQQYPGSAPGGTGLTGLTANDAQGWSDMQNRNTWALNKQREVDGQSPLAVKYGGDLGGMPPNLAHDPNWYAQSQAANPNLNLGPSAQTLMSGGALGGLQNAYGAQQKKTRQPGV